MQFAAGCSNAEPEVDETAFPIAGLTSGASCVSGTTLTYSEFGQPFMTDYCLRCHTIAIMGGARQAPPDRNFDDLDWIRVLAPQIDQQAGAGPAGAHTVMPPAGLRQPTLEERTQLSTWLACGAPK